MLAAQRRERILEQLEREGVVTVAALSRLLDVSEMTVRRDLDVLHADGHLTKVHGGATAAQSGRGREPGFTAKSSLASAAKLAIARAAAALVQPGSAVGLTAGTTTHLVAQELREMRDITIVTNSIRVADAFVEVSPSDIPVIVIGGTRTPSDALVGPMAVENMRSLNLDICFMGVHGMDEQAGFTTPNVLEAETNRAFAATARQFIVVADSSKWGEVGLARITPLDEATTVITDTDMPDDSRQLLSSHVENVIFANPEEMHDAPHP
ncbi:MAG: DeoR/GlpR family DNA-binding transcription regulator [Candidatus Nanopelagicales bacterium]